MAAAKFDMSPVEPAHPTIVKLHKDFVTILQHICEKYQEELDEVFDNVSRQIGFVVTTTIPVVMKLGDEGDVKDIRMGAEHLQDTLFERELSEIFSKLKGDSIKKVSSGTFNLLLIWHEALKIKLKTDWMEPAHFLKGGTFERIQPEWLKVKPGPRPWEEPAHWFDSGQIIASEEAVLIEAIDQVYPDLRLVDRVTAYRSSFRRHVKPEVMEPAHVGPIRPSKPENLEEVLKQIRRMLDWV